MLQNLYALDIKIWNAVYLTKIILNILSFVILYYHKSLV